MLCLHRVDPTVAATATAQRRHPWGTCGEDRAFPSTGAAVPAHRLGLLDGDGVLTAPPPARGPSHQSWTVSPLTRSRKHRAAPPPLGLRAPRGLRSPRARPARSRDGPSFLSSGLRPGFPRPECWSFSKLSVSVCFLSLPKPRSGSSAPREREPSRSVRVPRPPCVQNSLGRRTWLSACSPSPPATARCDPGWKRVEPISVLPAPRTAWPGAQESLFNKTGRGPNVSGPMRCFSRGWRDSGRTRHRHPGRRALPPLLCSVRPRETRSSVGLGASGPRVLCGRGRQSAL